MCHGLYGKRVSELAGSMVSRGVCGITDTWVGRVEARVGVGVGVGVTTSSIVGPR